jgi:hypothetical protein
MAVWVLSPVNLDAEVWKIYCPFQRIVVRGQDEDEAREQALRATFGSSKLEPSCIALKRLPADPWEDPAETSCTVVELQGT